MNDLHSYPLVSTIRDSFVWQYLIDDAPHQDQERLVVQWLLTYYGRDAIECGLTSDEIWMAFWLEPEEFESIVAAVDQLCAESRNYLEVGLSMEDADRLISDRPL